MAKSRFQEGTRKRVSKIPEAASTILTPYIVGVFLGYF